MLCVQPFSISIGTYEQWKEIEITLDLRSMIRGYRVLPSCKKTDPCSSAPRPQAGTH
jgi:hypothetical protein